MINFVTGNDKKFAAAQTMCHQKAIELNRIVIDLEEIQSEDQDKIITEKAKKAYEAVGRPIVVSDDSWSFPALNGFPGPYMKSVNFWFTTQDFLDLMVNKKDRTLILIKLLAYYDGSELVIFRKDSPGKVILKPKGNSPIPIRSIYVSDFDNGKTVAELDNEGTIDSIERLKRHPDPWHDLIDWLIAKNT